MDCRVKPGNDAAGRSIAIGQSALFNQYQLTAF
jgi:hypothetical protein